MTTKPKMRAGVRPGQFLVIRDGEYIPMRGADLMPGESVYYYRGTLYGIEPCTVEIPYLGMPS